MLKKDLKMSKATAWCKKNSTFWVVELGVIDAVPQSPFVSLSVARSVALPSNFSPYTSKKNQSTFLRPLFLLHGNATYAFRHRFAKVNWPITCSRTKKGLLIVRLQFVLLLLWDYYLLFSDVIWPLLARQSFFILFLVFSRVDLVGHSWRLTRFQCFRWL
jgi:hypothetical protein